MEMTILSIAKTYALAISLGAVAAGLAALLAVAVAMLASLRKKEEKLLKNDVYRHVLRPKRVILSKEAQERAAKKEAERQERQAQRAAGKPKRGKKNKAPKYVFTADVKSEGDRAETPEKNGAGEGDGA